MKNLFVSAAALLGVGAVNTCKTEYGSGAACVVETTCGPSNLQGGMAAGFCQDEPANVKCCMRFTLTNAFKYYSSNVPHQKLALDTFQLKKLRWYPEMMKTFACKFRNKTPDGTFCGDEIMMSNVAQYYDELPHQTLALNYLQDEIEKWAKQPDIDAWRAFVKDFRNVGAAADGGGAVGGCGTKKKASDFSLSANGLGVVTHFEGWYSCCYKDTEGIWTVGYGHACHVNSNDGSGCGSGNTCSGCLTRAKGSEILDRDMTKFTTCVRNAVKVTVTQNQFDALVSFAFNVGCGGLQDSTLLKMLNAGTLTPRAAQQQFTRWHSGCTEGLKRRRFTEAELFNSCLEKFPCSFNSCQVSQAYRQCSGTCQYCSSCGGCSGTATAAKMSVLGLVVAANQSLGDENEVPVPVETVQPDDWACSDTARNSTSSCQGDDVVLSTSDLAAAGGEQQLCTTQMAVTQEFLEEFDFDQLSKISADPSVHLQLSLLQTNGESALAQVTIEVYAASKEVAAQYGMSFEEATDGNITSVLMKFGLPPGTDTTALPPPGSDTTASSALSSAGPSRVLTVVLAGVAGYRVAGLKGALLPSAIALLPFVQGAVPSAACKVVMKVTYRLPPVLYASAVQAMASVDLDGIAVVTATEDTPTVAVADCAEPAVASVFPEACEEVPLAKELTVSASPLLVTSKFLLENVFNSYDGTKFPHQKCALVAFQRATDTTANRAIFQQFACAFRNKQTSAADPACGAAISLVDVGVNWSSQAHQISAAKLLQAHLEKNAGQAWLGLVSNWRQETTCVNWLILDSGRCGPLNQNAGCNPGRNYCCSSGGWCGQSEAHCSGGRDWRTPYVTPAAPNEIIGHECSANHPATPGKKGVCVKATACVAIAGATTADGLCPSDPADVKCCAGPADKVTVTFKKTISGRPCAGNHPLIGKPGVCITTTECSTAKGTSVSGLCPQDGADIKCCAGDPKYVTVSYPTATTGGACGSYAGDPTYSIAGNNNVKYTVVKVHRNDLSDSSAYNYPPDQKDNTMEVSTACAFDKMSSAAASAGVYIKIASAFRTVARQNYFYNCYVTGSCNGGNLAARPGTSNHGRGKAMDLNTNCGRQSGSRPSCGGSRVYQWLYNNAHKYGFARSVQSEPWHWEYSGSATTTRTWYS